MVHFEDTMVLMVFSLFSENIMLGNATCLGMQQRAQDRNVALKMGIVGRKSWNVAPSCEIDNKGMKYMKAHPKRRFYQLQNR